MNRGIARLLVAALALGSATLFAADELTDGEVRKVDKDAGRITLRHGEIKNIQMPPMTMAFRVQDPSLLAQVKPGDKVRFRVEPQGGTLLITKLVPAK